MRVTLLLFVQMVDTITPMFLFPNEVFNQVPYVPTLEGQYIIKNLVLITASLVMSATVRGGQLVAKPEEAKSRNDVTSHKESLAERRAG